MKLETMAETRYQAGEKWREYMEATKHSNNPMYKDLKKVYNQLKGGRKIIDINKVIIKGGINDWSQPNLAIAKMGSKFVWCCYTEGGIISFVNRAQQWSDQSRSPIKEDVKITGMPTFNCTSLISKGKMNQRFAGWGRMELKAPVPIVPPKHLPGKITDDYYILWEVEEWKIVPPKDPWLLKRITSNMFVVLAGWDLTEIERSVMAGRLI